MGSHKRSRNYVRIKKSSLSHFIVPETTEFYHFGLVKKKTWTGLKYTLLTVPKYRSKHRFDEMCKELLTLPAFCSERVKDGGG